LAGQGPSRPEAATTRGAADGLTIEQATGLVCFTRAFPGQFPIKRLVPQVYAKVKENPAKPLKA
jgi:hypothetical protein